MGGLACACRAWMAAPPSTAPATIDTAMVDRVFMMVLQWELQLLGFRLLVAGSLLRGLKLLHGLLQPGHGAFERDDLGVGGVELLRGLERILVHEPLQKVDVALKAPRALVQPGGFRAVLYSRDILRASGAGRDDDQAQAQHHDSDHATPLRSVPMTQPA